LDSAGGHMGRITSFSKQALKILICFCLVYTPFFANAASIGGWSLSNPVAQGASTLYEGLKNAIINGKNVAKTSTALITPAAADVAKVLRGGVAGYALSVAVEQLLGAVDWVLDPANNRIVYKIDIPAGAVVFICNAATIGSNDCSINRYTLISSSLSASELCGQLAASRGFQRPSEAYVSGNSCLIGSNQIVGYVGTAVLPDDREKKYLDLDVVAAQVISNAESSTDNNIKLGSQVATTAAAANIVSEAEKDAVKARPILHQLEANSKTATDETATGEAVPKDPTAPDAKPTDISIEFPVFCGWAPTVCEAAQVVISFPLTLSDWWETSKSKAESWASSIAEAWAKVKEEYANKPKENTDTQLDIPDTQAPDINTDIAFGGQCPATRSVPISFAGISTSIDFSFEWLCEIASIAKPVVISVSAFSAALIVAGVRGEDD